MRMGKTKLLSFCVVGLFIGLSILAGISESEQIKNIYLIENDVLTVSQSFEFECVNSYSEISQLIRFNSFSNELRDDSAVQNHLLLYDDELDQQQTDSTGYVLSTGTLYQLAQGFVPSMMIITRIQLSLFRSEDPLGSLTVSIRDSLDGIDLVSVSIDAELIHYPGSSWVEFDFEDIVVTPGQTYYIVATMTGSSSERFIAWMFGINNPYDKGDAWSNHSGSWNLLEFEQVPHIDFCFKTYGRSGNPRNPVTPSGPEEGKINKIMMYSTSTTDPLYKELYYKWDWGDGTTSEWLGPYASGEQSSASYMWEEKGIYIVKVKAKNTDRLESTWSDPLIVGIPVKNNDLDQKQEGVDTGIGITSDGMFAQSFIPTQNTLTQLSLYVIKKGNPGNVSISIHNELNDDALTSGVLSSNQFSDSRYIWITVDMADIELIPGEVYYIIWDPTNTDNLDNIAYWGFAANNLYNSGSAWLYNPPWKIFDPPAYPNPDFCFRTYYAMDKKLNNYTNYFSNQIAQRFTFLHERISTLLDLISYYNS